MKDRFKFRVWHNPTKTMEYNGLWTGYPNIEKKMSDCNFEVMQCTGLSDKNGMLIYEGDILYLNSCEMQCVIEWHKPSYRLMAHILGPDDIVDFDEILNEKGECPFEIIGNIYENKELLEEQK